MHYKDRLKKIARYNQISKSPRLIKSAKISDGLDYHIRNKIPLSESIFRFGSSEYYGLINNARELWKEGSLEVCEEDEEVLISNAGFSGYYNGQRVPLDIPFCDDEPITKESAKKKKKKKKAPPLGKPKRGGSKKFYVYVKCGGKVKKISFGSPDMPLRVSEPERRRSFVARHKCKQKKDRCTAGYWSCRIGRYPNLTGAKKKYTWW